MIKSCQSKTKSQKKGVKKMRKILIITLIGLFVLYPFSIKLFGLMWADDSCRFFAPPEGCDGGETTSFNNVSSIKYAAFTIGGLVSEGGTFFLRAKGYFSFFLSWVEYSELIQEPNYEEMSIHLKAAIKNIENTIDKYSLLCYIADNAQYNDNIAYLINYDYNGFKEKNPVDLDVFCKVEEFLSKGQIKEVYHYALEEFLSLKAMMQNIQASVDLKKFPDINNVWKANEKFLKLGHFGQNCSQIFKNVFVSRENNGT